MIDEKKGDALVKRMPRQNRGGASSVAALKELGTLIVGDTVGEVVAVNLSGNQKIRSLMRSWCISRICQT